MRYSYMTDKPPTMTRRHAPPLVFTVLALLLGPVCALTLTATIAGAAPAAAATAAMTMDQAVKMAEKRFHARVLKAATQKEGGSTTYVLRLLNDNGHVWTVKVDAANGSLK